MNTEIAKKLIESKRAKLIKTIMYYDYNKGGDLIDYYEANYEEGKTYIIKDTQNIFYRQIDFIQKSVKKKEAINEKGREFFRENDRAGDNC